MVDQVASGEGSAVESYLFLVPTKQDLGLEEEEKQKAIMKFKLFPLNEMSG